MDAGALADLKRRAYSSDGPDALAARQQLDELEKEHAEAQRLVRELPRELPKIPRVRALLLVVLGLATGVAVAFATYHAVILRPSLEVFDRAPTTRDAAAPELGYVFVDDPVESARWIGGNDDVDVYGYLLGNTVCILVVDGDSSTGNCAELGGFQRDGLVADLIERPIDVPIYLTVVWGPDGDARLYDVPLEDVPGR